MTSVWSRQFLSPTTYCLGWASHVGICAVRIRALDIEVQAGAVVVPTLVVADAPIARWTGSCLDLVAAVRDTAVLER